VRDDVGPVGEAQRERDRFGMREIERDAPLVRIEQREGGRRVEIDGLAGARVREPQGIGARLRLDAHHRRALLGEVARRERAGGARAELEDAEPRVDARLAH